MPVIQSETETYALTLGDGELIVLRHLPDDHPFFSMVGRVAVESGASGAHA